MRINPVQLLYGAATHLPGVLTARQRIYRLTDPGTISARYCYGVWMRHLVLAQRAGLGIPRRVIELGPGNSLGIGLAALLAGASEYIGLDVVGRVNRWTDLEALDELAELFRRRAAIPGSDELPAVKPYLADNRFPSDLLDAGQLAAALDEQRIRALRLAVAGVDGAAAGSRENTGVPGAFQGIGRAEAGPLRYLVPWTAAALEAERDRADLILSQAALEHVDDLDAAYQALARALRPGGVMSHQIDYKHHGTGTCWNGHWTYSDAEWRLLCGRRPYLINRAPHSAHRSAIERAGLRLVDERCFYLPGGLRRSELAPRFRDLSDDDLHCAGAYVLAVKPSPPSCAP